MLKTRILLITSLLLLAACSHGPLQEVTTPQADTSHKHQTSSTGQANADDDFPNQWAHKLPPRLPWPEQSAEPIEYNNVWARIRHGMQLTREIDQPTVRNKIEWYSRHQGYLDRVADRARPYIYHIVEELEARDLPMELALLPIVESAYQPLAYSRSHAAGLWQFIPATGRRYGLKQNWWYDGRRDVTAATDAALNYLESLAAQFDGNWNHAIAGYNAGENTVHRAIARNRAANQSTAFWHLDLPRETRGYVPALLAIAEIVARPDHYGVTLKPIDNQPYFTKVATGGQIDLGKAAKLAGIDNDEMKRLNPGYKRWATDPDGPNHLLIPKLKAQEFAQAIQQLPESERLTWRQHHIRRGETLSQIARRYGITVGVLQRTNDIRGHLIRAGQHLLIPGSGSGTPPSAVAQRDAADRKVRPEKGALHTVSRGDSLWTIARRYDTSVATLTSVNNISSRAVLRPGQQLKVPLSVDVDNNNGRKVVRYTVRRGDSLWSISRRFDVSVNALRQWNSLNQQALLQPGQELQLYVDNTNIQGI